MRLVVFSCHYTYLAASLSYRPQMFAAKIISSPPGLVCTPWTAPAPPDSPIAALLGSSVDGKGGHDMLDPVSVIAKISFCMEAEIWSYGNEY